MELQCEVFRCAAITKSGKKCMMEVNGIVAYCKAHVYKYKIDAERLDEIDC